MRKAPLMPYLYAVIGILLLTGTSIANQVVLGAPIHLSHFILPAIIGLGGGIWLGTYRRKWLEKGEALERAGRDLEQNLAEVRHQRQLTGYLEGMMENVPLPMYLKDREFRYLMSNPCSTEITGTTWAEMQGKTDHDLFPAPVAGLFREQDEEVLRKGTHKVFEETIPLGAAVHTFRAFKFPLRDDDGIIFGVGGINTDITEMKRTEDRLSVEIRRMEKLAASIHEGLLVTNPEGKVAMVNRQAEEALGLVTHEINGRGLDEINLPEDKKIVPLTDRFGQDMGLLVILPCEGIARSESPSEPELPGIDDPAPGADGPFARGRTILVMDDDHLVRKTSRLMLQRMGFEVLEGADGQEAVDCYEDLLIEGRRPDVVIMDLTVPGAMGGVEATEAILQMDPMARVLVASGYSNDPVMANFRDYGFLARVEKPFAVAKLENTLREILDTATP